MTWSGAPRSYTTSRLAVSISSETANVSSSCPNRPAFSSRKGVEGRILFRTNSAGKIDALIDRRNNEDVIWRKKAE
jgi:hypothetical protein